MNVLIVEDDQNIACTLEHLFSSACRAVDVLSSEEAGRLQLTRAFDYSLIVLDVTLAQPDGISLCQRLRAQGSQVPILFLTGQAGDHLNLSFPNTDRDDAIAKPFTAEDLMARANALLHSGKAKPPAEADGAQTLLSKLQATETQLRQQTERLQLAQETIKGERQRYQALQQRDHQRQVLFDYLEAERQQAESHRQQQWERERLITEITRSIRETLDLEKILQSAADQVRHLLQTDRVVVFRLQANQQGIVESESVAPGWPSMLSTIIRDSCFSERYTQLYRRGRVSAIADIYKAGFKTCHVDLLETFEIRANLVVPILQEDALWGLLVAHQCSAPRQWDPEHTQLLLLAAAQLGIAIQQAELYQQAQRELLERRQAQAALLESEERFRSLAAFAPVGIYQTDVEGRCLYTNSRWQEIAGLSFEESLGEGWARGLHPDDRPKVFEAWNHFVHEGQPFSLEFRFLSPQGDERWMYGCATAIYSTAGQVVGYVGVNEDISDRKQAERKITEQAALIDIATDAIFVRDLEDRIVFWSQGAERLYGWSGDQALGKIAHKLFGKAAESIIDCVLETVISEGYWQGELTQGTQSGGTIVVESRWTLMRDSAGAPQSLLVVNTDITEKKQLESQFYRAQRLESLGRLASGIAHDLNNVLTPVLAIAQLLRLTRKNLDAETQDHLELIERSAKRGAAMVKQILTFARGSYEEPAAVALPPLLEEVATMARQSFPRAIEIRCDFPSSESNAIKAVWADATQLHQVFMNLCTNARDAMPDGGTLTLSARPVVVDQAIARVNLGLEVGSYVVVTVTDTGVGIASEVRERMFEPFFTTKETGQGTGLGLATTLGIIKHYGGFLQVFSEVGKGTQIKVYLPTTEPISTESSALPESTNGNGRCILVVDDDGVVQHSTRSLLENHGYTTVGASDGVEAIAYYTQHKSNVKGIVMDVMMPNMGGIPLIEEIRAIDPTVKIMAVSGLATNLEPALAAGAHVFLTKPYALDKFLTQLSNLLQD